MLPAAELLSFLKQTHGPWTERELAKTLNLSSAETREAITAMQLQGYVEPAGQSRKWRTTDEGLTVSANKTPRFTPEAVEQALAALIGRIHAINDDASSLYTISMAVAFGDFLTDQPRVQAADVGIQLTPRNAEAEDSGTAVQHKADQLFLKQLRGKSGAFHLQPYEQWMSARSHRRLL